MKTKVYSVLALGLVLSLACACNKETRDLPAPGQKISVSAFLPEDTKVAAGDKEGGITWSWEEGDAITLVGKTSSTLSIDPGFTAKKATFSGKPVSGDSFSIIYPAMASVSAMDAITFDTQVQASTDSKAHLQYFALLQDIKSYSSFEFSPSWAASNGASFKQGGVLKIVASLPAETTMVTKLAIKASAPVFHADNGDTMTDALAVTFEESALPESKTLVAWFTTSWHDTAIPAGTTIQFTAAAGDFTWLSDLSIPAEKVIKSGCVNVIELPASVWYNTGRYSGGAGTAASPWIITKPEQMNFIKEDLVAGDIRYFKLGADIDMSGITGWEPLNYASPYDKQIDFDGADHTISGFTCDYPSYPSFFGVLYGACRNVKFVNAVINCSNNTGCGIIGGYGGTGDKHADVFRVHVQGEVNFTGNKTGIGGMFGQLANASLNACSADVNVTSGKNYVGGLCGYIGASTVSVENCWTSGSVAGNQRAGGITGGVIKEGSVIRNCYSLSAVSANFCIAGIAGHCNLDQKSGNPDVSTPGNVIEKCIAWNESIKANSVTEGDKSHYSGGAIAGYTSMKNTLADCMRKADLVFVEYSDLFGLYDQENASAATPLVVNAVEGATYNYPYHGKAAAAGATLSQVAQALGWPADVWDFSGSVPVLK